MNKTLIMLFFILFSLNLSAQQYMTHTVKEKETLYQISRLYNVSVEEIIKINNISDPGKIKKGDILNIKIKNENKTNPDNNSLFTVHTVKKDETLWQISRKYGINIKDILAVNGINDQNAIKEGMIIKIPENSKDTTEENKNIKEDKIHVIKEKETLYRISKIYNVSVDEIIKLNGINDPSKLKTGMTIKIPSKSTSQSDYPGYDLPASGEIKIFDTTNFSGIHIYTDADDESRKVFAIDAGIVSYVDNVPGYGLTVFIRHNNDYISTYSGFSEIYVKEGSKVTDRQIIGKAGTITRSDKYGIVFSIQRKGNSLKFNPDTKKFIK